MASPVPAAPRLLVKLPLKLNWPRAVGLWNAKKSRSLTSAPIFSACPP